ncbi:MAG TPA: hypothetical protein VGF99_14425 [Myxococcota bacterium]
MRPVRPTLVAADGRSASAAEGRADSRRIMVGGSPVWPIRGQPRQTLLRALSAAKNLGTGELVAVHGDITGRIFLHEGRVAWVVAGDDRQRLTDVLVRNGVDAAVLKAAVIACQKAGTNLGEALIGMGVADAAAIRAALREHNAAQLEALLSAPLTSLRFTAIKRAYAAELVFDVDELLVRDRRATPAVVETRSTAAPATSGVGGNETSSGEDSMSTIKSSLDDIMSLDGAIAAAIVDWESGLTLGSVSNGSFDIELAASGNCSVVKAKANVMRQLGIKGGIEDMLITLEDQYHLIRPVQSNGSLFIYVAIDKNRGNLGLARHKLRQIEAGIKI